MDRRTVEAVEPAPEEIRCEMAETRAALTDKLEMLEGRVNEKIENVQHRVEATVDMAKDTVHDTVEKVKATVEKAKDTVHDTVEMVKATFDIRQQVNEHPWTMVGGAVAVGFLLGRQLGRSDWSRTSFRNLGPSSGEIFEGGESRGRSASGSLMSPPGAPDHKNRLFQRASAELHHQIDSLENAAISAAGNLMERLIKQAVPGLGAFLH
jgi:ElaB/YqjD/DUF883 family membrane-anchored ribosome-binding protein